LDCISGEGANLKRAAQKTTGNGNFSLQHQWALFEW